MAIDEPSEAQTPRCLTCDYSLRGLPGNRCPECGRSFDPNDPTTMNLGRHIGPTARKWLRPVGWPVNAAVGILAAAVLLGSSVPGGYSSVWFFSIPCCLIIATFWLARLIGSLGAAWYYRQPRYRLRRTWLHWSIAPAIVAVTVCLPWLRAPFWMRFYASRPSMNRLAQQVMRSSDKTSRGRWIGLYRAEDIEAVPGGMRFIVSGAGFLDRCGFAYSPYGPPPDLGGEDYYRALSDGWYQWIEGW